MAELSDWDFKTMITNTLRGLMDKIDIMQEQRGNRSRKMEILRKNINARGEWIGISLPT